MISQQKTLLWGLKEEEKTVLCHKSERIQPGLFLVQLNLKLTLDWNCTKQIRMFPKYNFFFKGYPILYARISVHCQFVRPYSVLLREVPPTLDSEAGWIGEL